MSPVQPLLQHFAHLHDPRVNRTKLHSLDTILTIAICAVICGAEGWTEVEEFGLAKAPFFAQLLDIPHGIPSHDTFGKVFAALDTEAFAEGFTAWISTLAVELGSDIVAIDGKTMRRSLDKANGKAAIHLVSAFACANRLVLGQVKVDDKSNEITAIPALLRRLVLTGCLVTIDAMGCQKTIASQLHDAGADYVLSLKGNHSLLHDDVQCYFDYLDTTATPPLIDEKVDGGHGRVERRRVQCVAVDWCAERGQWPGLQSFVRVHSERHIGDKVSHETRYFISSLPVADVARAAQAVRRHWQIENQLHWCLDIAFNEDQQRMRSGNAAANMALLNKIALNLLKHSQSKVGIKGRRKRAGWDDRFLLTVLSAAGSI
jgi:predicted transposase YbfD/YdcC